jgi:hypothetical protein
VISGAAPATALLGLDTAELLDDLRHQVAMGCGAMDRSEPALIARGARLVGGFDAEPVHQRMLPLLGHTSSELRMLALRYAHRFRLTAAARFIEDVATSAHFVQRPWAERVMVGLAYGATGGRRATEVAARQLGEDWRYLEAERAAPWILCLACGGDPRASAPLDWLEAQRLPGLSAALTDARNALNLSVPPGAGLP